jgi:hypothetical protein
MYEKELLNKTQMYWALKCFIVPCNIISPRSLFVQDKEGGGGAKTFFMFKGNKD